MTRILSGTAAVVGGGRTVTFTGAPLSDANCPADATVVLGGAGYFIDHRVDTSHFVVTRDYEGATASVSCEIDPTNANAISFVKITRLITDYNARLALLDADGKGLFFSSLGVTGANDPGPGRVGRNNAAWALTTALYLDVIDAAGREVSGLIDLWASGTIVIVRSLATGAYASFKLGNNAINEGPDQWRRLVGLTFVESSGAIADGEDVAIDWKINGEGLHIDATGLFADRAAFDNRSVPFTFVSTNGTGAETLARIYFKQSNAAGDWSPGVPFQGAKGDKGDKGDASTVPGITWQGAYNAGTAYVINDGVKFNGSSFRNILPGTGVAPSSANPPVDNASWVVVAAKGTDGAGTGNVINLGPASNLRIAVFDADGQHIKDGGKTIAELVPAGYDDLLMSISLLALQVADNSNAALFLGTSGNRIADSFKALTYVDVAGATNLDVSVSGLLKPTEVAGTVTAAIALPTTFSNGVLNIRNVFAASVVSTSGNFVRVKIDGPGSGTAVQLVSVWIGHAAASGDVYDYDGNQVQFRFSGLTSITPPVGGSVYSDWVALNVDETKNLIVSVYFPTTNSLKYNTAAPAGYTFWYKAATGADEAGITNATGYTNAAGFIYFVSEIQVRNASAGNVTVRSAAFTAASVPAKMKAMLRVKEIDAATAGADYTLECSRDGGTTWALMTLTELFTSPSPTAGIRVVEAAETDVSGQPSGAAPRWRFKTFNNKNVELHDVYFYWS